MSDINVDDFFQDAARALLILYQAFPRPRTLFVDDICGPEEPDEFGMHSDRFLACFGALVWLGEEGFLRSGETVRQEAVDQAVLTSRCFTLLTTPARIPLAEIGRGLPESVELERSSNIHQVREALKARSSTALRRIMLSLLEQMNGRG
jgi:hypothetical protein